MTQIANIDAYRPHLVIYTEDEAIVVPVAVIQKIVDGEMDVTDMDDFQSLIKAILADWLKRLPHPTRS